ncbi:hypothetical protein ACJJIE_23120 [Microbulbifer sp. TRSA001]|uniref:hypothetical protein n=1 Tax=Microbulbifer sp. TRSA001 TaxID=3243381 RepID=UPI00403911BE
MAFDYGSIDLGLKNPFKKEGRVTAIRGGVQFIVALILLFIAAGQVKLDPVSGWVLVVVGAILLVGGIRALSGGILALLRFFVGRNHPVSLAFNHSKSETSTASEEKNEVAYTASGLEEMLVGRKNPTFLEPKGFLARVLHSIFPKLLYMPYPIRNMAQAQFGAWVSTLTVLLSYVIVAFICLNGFAGDMGEKLFPMYSAIALLYTLIVWHSASKGISREAQKSVASLTGGSIAKTILFSIVVPLLLGLGLSLGVEAFKGEGTTSLDEIISVSGVLTEALPSFSPFLYILGVIFVGAACSFAVVYMLRFRSEIANPVTEVSELRDNWQESVHPKEIFINLDNLVMANRRYKEVPNRIYRELDPKLEEQVDGKGSFNGEMIQEVQPTVRPVDLGEKFKLIRDISLFAGNALYIVVTALAIWLAYSLIDVIHFFQPESLTAIKQEFGALDEEAGRLALLEQYISAGGALCMTLIHLLLIGFILNTFARLLVNAAHIFFAEMQFESLLVYFKCEGTFTESKISTGTGIHDSTRSENVLVRSSITPWVIVTRVVSSTFAASGMRNLEYPRHILEMHKSERDLSEIRDDVISFLKDRESIASITSSRDLENTSNIHAINQQSRALPMTEQGQLAQDENAAGYLRQEDKDTVE